MKVYIKMLLLIALFSFAINVFAQQKAVKGQAQDKEEVVKFGIMVKHPVNTFSNFVLTENTRVHRVYSDSTTKDYQRNIVYYYTVKVEDSPQKGFQTVIIVVDSLNYLFKDGDKTLDYHSVDMSGNASRTKDLNFRTPVLGREFNLVYSPYGEVSKIDGSDIKELTDYIDENKSYMKPIELFMWNTAVSFERLSYIGDNKKIILPRYRIPIDSIWYSPISIELNGYAFKDTAAMKIDKYNSGIFLIKGTMKNLTHINRNELMYNVSKLINIDKTVGTGKIELEMTARGKIKRTKIQYRAVVRAKVGDDYVDEVIDSSIEWKKTGTFRL